jgi:cell division protein FtsI/penicillin-binding protein 2
MDTVLRRARNRQLIIFLLVCASMIALSGKLYYWQIVRGPWLAQQANAEHTQSQTIDAPRGNIYDAQGLLLATNIEQDDLYVDPAQIVTDYPYTYTAQRQSLANALHHALPSLSVTQLMADLSLNSYSVPVAQSLSTAQSQQLQGLQLPYTFLVPRTVRDYPGGNLASQVLGFVQEEPGGTDRGLYGVEGTYNTLLAGKPGSFTAETALNGVPLTVGASSAHAAVNGADIHLTLDSVMQYAVQNGLDAQVKAMEAASGTAIVVNIHTGAIIAMASSPSFDPNHYGQYANQKGCINTLDVYINPALYCTYEPGSTMKMVTMAAALDQHLITPQTTLDDSGSISFNDGTPPVTNWDHLSYGTETMTQVLQHSANVGAAYVAHDILGPQRFYPYLQRFGFGQTTGLLQPEAAGYYRQPGTTGWTPSDLTRQSFGQAVTVTPIQMLMAYQAIANDGVLLRPSIVTSIDNNGHVSTPTASHGTRVVSSSTASQLTGMLIDTAQYEHITVPGYTVAIKTGTATTVGISNDQTVASVVGYLPASQPQFAILVKLDRPQATIYGGQAAGPLWMSIAQQLMWRYNVPSDQ